MCDCGAATSNDEIEEYDNSEKGIDTDKDAGPWPRIVPIKPGHEKENIYRD